MSIFLRSHVPSPTFPGAGLDCTSACFDLGSQALNFASQPPVSTVPVLLLYSTHRTAFSWEPSNVTAPVSRSILSQAGVFHRVQNANKRF